MQPNHATLAFLRLLPLLLLVAGDNDTNIDHAKQPKSMADDPYLLVATEHGPVQGKWNKNLWEKVGGIFSPDSSKYSRMFGRYPAEITLASIPFAAAPVGENRFRSPQPVQHAWGTVKPDGTIVGRVLDATSPPV
ncbi:MAG TPA: hypothetical protein VHR86_00380, partial [Armatimonadota bacterium]|nr:hypothetical protein [Armatimonadota bacterium]